MAQGLRLLSVRYTRCTETATAAVSIHVTVASTAAAAIIRACIAATVAVTITIIHSINAILSSGARCMVALAHIRISTSTSIHAATATVAALHGG